MEWYYNKNLTVKEVSASYVDSLLASMRPAKDPELDEECLTQWRKDFDRKLCSDFMTRQQVDKKYGKSQ